MFCKKCGAKLGDGMRFCSFCGAEVQPEENAAPPHSEVKKVTEVADAPAGAPMPPMPPMPPANAPMPPMPPAGAVPPPNAGTPIMQEPPAVSQFTGGAFANAFIKWIAAFVSLITLGLAYPAMVCWHNRWEAKHTYYDGRQLTFVGKAGNLFGKYILWALLTVVTIGLYYVFCARVAMQKWIVKNTHFKDSDEGAESKFDGTSMGLIGVNWLTGFVTVITLTFGAYWAHCYKERWFQRHTVIDGVRMSFNGRGLQYFGKRVLWTFLTIITIGIYGFWLAVKSKKWTVSHTHAQNARVVEVGMNAAGVQNKPKKDGLCIAGLVLGILSFLLPFGLFSFIGLICSSVAVAKKKQPKGYAVAGLVLSCITLLCLILSVAMFLYLFFTSPDGMSPFRIFPFFNP